MNISIVLVLLLNVVCTHSHCGKSCQLRKVISSLVDTLKENLDNCYCVRTYKCYQEDISRHATCVDSFDRIDTDYVCCRRPVRFTYFVLSRNPSPQLTTQGSTQTSTQIPITSPPTQIGPSSSQSQLHDTSQDSHSTSTDCSCMTPSDCHDEEFENVSQHEKESCQNPTHVCCFGLVQPVTPPQPQKLKPTPLPQSTSPTTIHTQDQTFNSTLQTGTTDKNCTCTPFYKCYDDESSSNLTGIVNDRLFTPNISGMENDRTSITIVDDGCSDPNDVCCHNLIKITAKPTIEPSSEDCAGSCISINECPYLLSKLKEAQNGTLDAVQELRRSVCSKTDGILHVCCPSNGSPPCQFPFIYKDVEYTECTTIDDPEGKLWCSTETDSKSNHVNDQWRHCIVNAWY